MGKMWNMLNHVIFLENEEWQHFQQEDPYPIVNTAPERVTWEMKR
jgi:hypothetical protein